MIALPRPCVCLVTNRRALRPEARTEGEELAALEHQLDEAIDAGIDLIQVRERDLDARVLRSVVARLVARSRGRHTRVLVNDRADVAIAADAGGVHLRADGPAARVVRELAGPRMLIGRSAHAAGELDPDADYLLFGTVFPSGSKPGAPVVGTNALAEAARASAAPVLAIGGVTPDTVGACRAAGAAGVAAIGVFLPPGRAPGALGPKAALAAIRASWGNDMNSTMT